MCGSLPKPPLPIPGGVDPFTAAKKREKAKDAAAAANAQKQADLAKQKALLENEKLLAEKAAIASRSAAARSRRKLLYDGYDQDQLNSDRGTLG